MLNPNDRLKKFWLIVLALLLTYTALVMPFRMAFIDSFLWDDWFIAELVIDSLFAVDIIVNMFSSYHNYEGTLITERKEILLNYLQGWLILDIIA